MPDYIPEATLADKIASVISESLDGVAEGRNPNQLILNPDRIVLDFNVLFTGGENAVSTEATETIPEVTEIVTDTPGAVTDVSQRTDNGRTINDTNTPPARSTSTSRSGQDFTETDRDYEDFE